MHRLTYILKRKQHAHLKKAKQTMLLIISRLSYSLFNANYSTRELFLRARRGNIYRGAHLAYLHRTKEKTNEIKISVTNGGIQVVVLLYGMFL